MSAHYRKARAMLTPEDTAIFRGNVRALNMAERDTADGSVMYKCRMIGDHEFPFERVHSYWAFIGCES